MVTRARLVAFGCSLTYGDGLPDCYVPNPLDPLGYHAGPSPSATAWPSLAAGMLGMDCENLARSGNSNRRILMDIIGHAWTVSDVAAILWTYPDRDVLFGDHGSKNIGAWSTIEWDPDAVYYYAAHSDADLQMRTWLYQHHAASYLASIGVPFAMSSISEWPMYQWDGPDYRCMDHTSFDKPYMDDSLDGLHGGPMQHASWAGKFAAHLSAAIDGG